MRIVVLLVLLSLPCESLFAQECTLGITGDTLWCAGTSQRYSTGASEAADARYRWFLVQGQDTLTGSQFLSPSDTSVLVEGLAAGRYRIASVVLGAADSVLSLCSLPFTVAPPPAPEIRVAEVGRGADTLCTGTRFTLEAVGDSTWRYRWNTGDTTARIDVLLMDSDSIRYSVVAVDTLGCVGTDDYLAVPIAPRSPLLTLTELADGNFCAGTGVQLRVDGLRERRWSTGDTSSVIVLDNLAAGLVTIAVSGVDLSGCEVMTDTSFTIKPLPEVDIQAIEASAVANDGLVCRETDLQLVALGGEAYRWNDGRTSDTIPVSGEEPGTQVFSVTATQNGCRDSATRAITVFRPPVAAIGRVIGNRNVDRLLTVENESTPGDGLLRTWSWVLGVPGDVSPRLSANRVPPAFRYSSTGVKRLFLTATDDNGCRDTTSQEVVIVGENSCQIIGGTENREVCLGERFSISPIAQIAGTEIVEWQWTFPPGVTDLRGGATGNPSMIISQPGVYRFTVSFTDNLSPSPCSSPEVTFIYAVRPRIIPELTLLSPQPVCPNGQVEILVSGLEPDIMYNLLLNENRQFMVSDSSVIRVRVGATGEETIAVRSIENRTTNCGNEVDDERLTVRIADSPDLVVDGNFARPCPGGELVLEVLNPDRFSAFTWRDPENAVSVTEEGRFVGPAVPGVYRISATDVNGCTGTGMIDVNLASFPATPTIEGPAVVCANQSASYRTVAVGEGAYRWRISGPGEIVDSTATGVTVAWGSGPATATVSLVLEATPDLPRDACFSNPALFAVDIRADEVPPPTEVVLISQNNRDYFLAAVNENTCYQWGSAASGDLPGETFRTLFLGNVAGGEPAIREAGYYVEAWNGDCASTDACRNRSFYETGLAQPDFDFREGQLEVGVSPNPVGAGTPVRLQLSGAYPGGELAVDLYGFGGRTVSRFAATADRVGEADVDLPTAGLAAGYYLITARDRVTGVVVRTPLIVRR